MKFKIEMTARTELRHNLYEFLTLALLSHPNEKLLDSLSWELPKEMVDHDREDVRLAKELHDSLIITEIGRI
jgi:hypothetical protein